MVSVSSSESDRGDGERRGREPKSRTVSGATLNRRNFAALSQIQNVDAKAAAAGAGAGKAPGAEPASAPPLTPAKDSTFFKSMQISLHEPVGSMSLSPANRDVVLGARKGLFIIDLENPYEQPRVLAHLTTWEVADIQWNPHPARAHWVASTSNQKLLIWNLDRPARTRAYVNQSSTSLGGSTHQSIRPSLGDHRSTFSRTSASGPSQPSGGLSSSFHTSGGGSLKGKSRSMQRVDTAGGASSFFASSYGAPMPVIQRRLSPISHVLQSHTRAITDINWSVFAPDVVASCGIDAWTWVWDLRVASSGDAAAGTSISGRPVQGYCAWNASATQVKWNRASPHRLATSVDNKVLIWDERKGSLPLATIEAHESRIYGIDWSRDVDLGIDRLVTCSLDGSVKFWNLGSDHAQGAIGRRELVTVPDAVIETPTPVWRARHLPFGEGVMTLPQRGDNSLSMWSKDEAFEQQRRLDAGEEDVPAMQPVARFEGHTDIVKEYLFRSVGGGDPSNDDRQFQLITWSKDQTLRLWPVSEQMTKSVGHKPGSAIRVRFTRRNAPDISYRVPPIEQDLDASAITDAALDLSVGISSPVLSSGANSAHSLRSPQLGQSPFGPSSQHSSGYHGPPKKGILRGAVHGLTSLQPSLSMFPHDQPGLSGVRVVGGVREGGGSRKRAALQPGAKEGARRRKGDKRAAAAKTAGFMTVTGARPGPFRFQRSVTAAADPLDWIARVKMHDDENRDSAGELLTDDDDAKSDTPVSGAENPQAAEPKKKVAHSLSDEIMSVSKKLPRVIFEKIEIAKRNCVLALYGPWASREPSFLRISFSFPQDYPESALSYELERSAKIGLRTRAFLLRNLSSIASDFALQGKPAMEPCVRFLLGETLPSDSLPPRGRGGQLTDGESSSEEDEPFMPAPQLEPVRCGASFGLQGQLVVFAPARVQPWLREAAPRSGSRKRSSSRQRQGNGSDTSSRPGRTMGPSRDRFLKSYDALGDAMRSLADKAGGNAQATESMDVLQLMSSDFVSRRAEQQQQQARSGGHRRGQSLARAALAASASNVLVDEPDKKESAAGATGYLSSLQALSTQASEVHIYDVSHLVPTPRGAFARKRSSSLPHSAPPSSRPSSLPLAGELPSPSPSASPLVRSPLSPRLVDPRSEPASPSGLQKSRSISGLRSFFSSRP